MHALLRQSYNAISNSSSIQQKLDKCLGHNHSILILVGPAHRIFKMLVIEDSSAMSHGQYLPHDILSKLWMSLHSEEPLVDIHRLYIATSRVCQFLRSLRVHIDYISMHLM